MRQVTAGSARPARLRVAAVLTCCVGLLVMLCGGMVDAATPVPSDEADAALGWLSGRLAANGHAIPGFGAGTVDWGLTADAVLAFAAAGRATDPEATATLDRLAANATAATTWTAQGSTVRDLGATAKTLLALRSAHRSPVADGVDLDAELRSMMATTGPQTGRFSDRAPDPSWNAANGFGQAMSMLALALSPDGVPASAVTFLLAQQCPAGGFRLTYGTTPACSDDAQADSDATALALQALLSVDRTTSVLGALRHGTDWLLSRQAPDGSFGGTGPTAAANANSTGLIAQYLRAAGQTAAADRAAAWITSCCQLTTANTAGTPVSGDVGALAYNPAALAAARRDGITTGAADQWYRTGSQAVLALGLAPYGPASVDPLPPTTDTTTTTSTSTSTTVPTSTTTAPTATAAPPTSAPDPGTIGATVQSEQQTAPQTGDSSTVAATSATTGTSGPTTHLATTGSDDLVPVGAGLLLLVVGAAIAVAARREGRRA